MIPACDHTGTPLHFHSSTTSGSACLMRIRSRPRVSLRFTRATSTHLATSRSHSFAGQKAGLLHPGGELSFVELVVLVDVEAARVLALGRSRRDRTQRRAAEESQFDVG